MCQSPELPSLSLQVMVCKVTSEEVINPPGTTWPDHLKKKCLYVGLIVCLGVTRLSRCCRPSLTGLAEHPEAYPAVGYLTTLTPIPNRLLQHPDTLTSLSTRLNRIFRP